jgi:hypothetical protein
MAGGMILMGVLLTLLSVPDAMALHAVTQMASNLWRSLLWWRYVRPRAVGAYLCGCAVAMLVWSLWRYVPSKPLALVLLGVTPFLLRLAPRRLRPDPERLSHGIVFGGACMTLLLLTGVAGPLLDAYFLGGRLERREIVATKAASQVFGHAVKLAYFSGMVDQAATLDPIMAVLAVGGSMAGTSLARPVLDRLTDLQYRRWAGRLITAIACAYLAQAAWLTLFVPG